MRVLDTIPLDKDHFVSRYSNVAYHQRQQYINSINLPYPIFSDKEVTFPKDVLVIPYIEKYFHNFLEFIPKILFLLQQHQKFTVIVVVDKDMDYSDELKIPYGWIKSDDGQDSSYFKEMLDNLKVDYMCVKSSSDFYKNLVARSAYIFFDRKEFLFDKKLNRNYPEEMYFKTFSPFEACVTQTIDLLVGHVEILRSWFPRYKSKGKKIYISRKNFSDRKIKNEEFVCLPIPNQKY